MTKAVFVTIDYVNGERHVTFTHRVLLFGRWFTYWTHTLSPEEA